MSDPNSGQQPNPSIGQKVGDFAADAAIDTTADGFINQGVGAIEARIPIPGGEIVDKMIITEVDQVVNNEINTEVNKGAGGIIGDVEGIFHHKKQ